MLKANSILIKYFDPELKLDKDMQFMEKYIFLEARVMWIMLIKN